MCVSVDCSSALLSALSATLISDRGVRLHAVVSLLVICSLIESTQPNSSDIDN